ncbi:hypothetical protein [Alteribacter populi]|uniref:hypothetical protein n=1 Tax=Alteribacter populi TaxID=2011011 RepID=UPI000BBAC6F4|nr:hypothetical protein [Alteribacter populi]
MKNYIIFAASFTGLWVVVQLISGIFLTMNATQEINIADGAVSVNQVSFGQSNPFFFIFVLAAAILAYAITEKFTKQQSRG